MGDIDRRRLLQGLLSAALAPRGAAHGALRSAGSAAVGAMVSVAASQSVSGAAHAAPAGRAGAKEAEWREVGFGFKRLDLKLPGQRDIARHAAVLVPPGVRPGQRLSVLVLLHGYAQARRTGRADDDLRATRAWERDYGVTRAAQRLANPPVSRLYPRAGYVSDAHLARLNRALSVRPAERLVLVCPRTPVPYYEQRTTPLFEAYARWITSVLLPEVRRRAPASQLPARAGIAGHSMGGEVALEVFARRPKDFGACMLLQPALLTRRAPSYAERLASLPAPKLHLLTTTRDPYRAATRALRSQLTRAEVSLQFTETSGPHAASLVEEIGALTALYWMGQVLSPSA